MRNFGVLLAALSAASFAAADTVQAQYNYPPPPPGYYGRPPPPGYYGPPPGYDDRPCPPGFTVQDGVCKPYRGPTGGGRPSWNGCPRGYTVQNGECRPYRGY
jgi:hypothetical protein